MELLEWREFMHRLIFILLIICSTQSFGFSLSTEQFNEELNIAQNAKNITLDPGTFIGILGLAGQFKGFNELILTPEGDFYVFRKLKGPYDSGKTGKYSANEGHYSYSLNPYITNFWGGNNTEAHIIIGRLRYENMNSFYYPARQSAQEDFVIKFKNGVEGKFCYFKENSKFEDIAYYDEIDVPYGRENVIADLSDSDFRKIIMELSKSSSIDSPKGKAFLLKDLIIKALMLSRKVSEDNNF